MAHSLALGRGILSVARTFYRLDDALDFPLTQRSSQGKWKIWNRISHGHENSTLLLRIFPMGRNKAALRALFGTPIAHVSNGSWGKGNGIRDTGYGKRGKGYWLSKTVKGNRGSEIDAE